MRCKHSLCSLLLVLIYTFGAQAIANAAQVDNKLWMYLEERALWGEGTVNYKAMNRYNGKLEYNHSKVVRPTIRTRVYAGFWPDDNTEFCIAGEDHRFLKEHNLDKHMQIFRGYFGTYNDHWRVTAGRFGWVQGSGNVMDETLDGIRLTTGMKNDYVSVFTGRIGKEQDRREGLIIEGSKKWRKWDYLGAFYSLHKDAGASRSWSKQKILSNRLTYHFNDKFNASYEHLWSEGRTQIFGQDNKMRHENGYVLRLAYGDYDYKKKDSYRLRLMYYHQPQSSIITHTMNGFPSVFDGDDMNGNYRGAALGMKGFGFNYDWVVRKGLLLTVEAYDLRNIHNHQYYRDVHQQVIGASLTFVM